MFIEAVLGSRTVVVVVVATAALALRMDVEAVTVEL